jgi:hypothetical protein
MPKGRIINSCTVDHRTVFMLIMETQVSKLTKTLHFILTPNTSIQSGTISMNALKTIALQSAISPLATTSLTSLQRHYQCKPSSICAHSLGCATTHKVPVLEELVIVCSSFISFFLFFYYYTSTTHIYIICLQDEEEF